MTAHPHPHRAWFRTHRRVALTLGAFVVVLALAGCDLRLESAPPAEPTPGPAEQVRARTVADALALAAAATSARPAADDATAAVLDDVAAFSTAHAGQLGGVYDSGLPEPAGSSAPTTVTATPGDVLGALRTDAATALADAAAADDGAMARLLAAVGVARDELAARLAAALGEPAPAAPTATATPPLPTTTAPVPEASDGGALPGGLAADDVAPLVLAHDQAGFGLEVVAAKLDGDARQAAYASAEAHRAAAEDWAQRAGIADTGRDPRRAAYALPTDVDDPDGMRALAASLETGVADAASAALVHTATGGRDELLGELTAATAAATTWGAAPTAFPGLRDLG